MDGVQQGGSERVLRHHRISLVSASGECFVTGHRAHGMRRVILRVCAFLFSVHLLFGPPQMCCLILRVCTFRSSADVLLDSLRMLSEHTPSPC